VQHLGLEPGPFQGTVQLALVVAADQVSVLGERDVALHDARSHACAALVGFLRVLRKFQSAAAMSDRKARTIERAVLAFLHTILELTFVHALDQVEGTRAELHGRVVYQLAMRVEEATAVIPIVIPAIVETLIAVGSCSRCAKR
jgi:hypothetical protein